MIWAGPWDYARAVPPAQLSVVSVSLAAGAARPLLQPRPLAAAVSLWPLSIGFHLLTALGHLVQTVVVLCRQPAWTTSALPARLCLGSEVCRWLEYAVTAPLMVLQLLLLAGERSWPQLVTACACCHLMVLLGGLVPRLAWDRAAVSTSRVQARTAREEEPAPSADTHPDGGGGEQDQLLAEPSGSEGLALPYWDLRWRPRRAAAFAGSTLGGQHQHFQVPGSLPVHLTHLTLFCWACSWLLCVLALLPVWAAAQGVQSSLPREVRKWIRLAVILQTVFFISFGGWETFCACYLYRQRCAQLVTGHLTAELGYCGLSLFSKTALTLLALQSLQGQTSAGWLQQPGCGAG
eukprot:g11320.t1